jgi:hypothetical protein
MNETIEFRFKRGGFFRGWGIALAILITVYFLWRIGHAFAGSMPEWVAMVSAIGIIYTWYMMLTPVKAIRLSDDGCEIFTRGLGSRQVQVEDIQIVSPWLNISKRDFVLKHASGRQFLFEDPDLLVVFIQELVRMNQGIKVSGMATVSGSNLRNNLHEV